jgi:hypothetical protein
MYLELILQNNQEKECDFMPYSKNNAIKYGLLVGIGWSIIILNRYNGIVTWEVALLFFGTLLSAFLGAYMYERNRSKN